MRLLSIQSQVAVGHVGNSAAVLPLQRLGVEVLQVPTVLFSNHTGHGAWRGLRLDPAQIAGIVLGIEERGALADLDVVLSGYLGDEGVTAVVADAVRRARAASPGALYACDPVMGNAVVGRFVAPGIPDLVRRALVPLADVITPNQFELGLLTGRTPSSLAGILEAVDRARDLGPTTVLVTSVARDGAEPGTVEMLVADERGAWLVATPRLPGQYAGTGDVTAALFVAHLRSTGDAARSLERTASSVHDLVALTADAVGGELRLVEAQDRFAHPSSRFAAERVR